MCVSLGNLESSKQDEPNLDVCFLPHPFFKISFHASLSLLLLAPPSDANLKSVQCCPQSLLSYLHFFFFFSLLSLAEFHSPVFKCLTFSASSSLLLNSSSISFSSVTSIWGYHCVCPFHYSTFMIIVLNSSSDKSLTAVSVKVFSWCFIIPLFIFLDSLGFYLVDETTTCPSPEAAVYKRRTLSFNPVLALGCLSNLCDCSSSPFYFYWLPALGGMPRHFSDPKKRIIISTYIQADEKPDRKQQLLKCVNITL